MAGCAQRLEGTEPEQCRVAVVALYVVAYRCRGQGALILAHAAQGLGYQLGVSSALPACSLVPSAPWLAVPCVVIGSTPLLVVAGGARWTMDWRSARHAQTACPSMVLVITCLAQSKCWRGELSDQVLKDKRGFTIGKISTDNRGIQTIKDARGFKKGSYDPKTNRTKDERGFTVGTGNLLATLL